MTREELMEQLVDLAQFDKVPNSEKGELLGNELQAILQWMIDRPRPQPDAWESFYLAAAIGQLAAQNFKTALACSRKVFDTPTDRHALIGMPPTDVRHLERALAAVRRADNPSYEPADNATLRSNRFPVAA